MVAMAGGSNAEEKCVRFFILLMSAFCEWSLILVLLINSVLGYVAGRFARFCRLPPPCVLCSRLDYIIGSDRRLNLYRNLFCHDHKLDISTMVYCQGHWKLADFRNMCDACLRSSAATAGKKARPVFGLYLADDEDVPDDCREEDLDRNPLAENKLDVAALGSTRCSCCSEPVSPRRLHKARRLVHRSNAGGGVSNRRGAQLRKRPEKAADLPAAHAYDQLSHAGYSELKISSTSESDGTISGEEGDADGGYSSAAPRRVKDIKEESVTRSGNQKALPMEDMVPERLIHPNPETNSKPDEQAASDSKTDEVNWSSTDVQKNRSEDSSERTIEQVPPQGSATESVSNSANPEGDGGSSPSAGMSSDQSMSEPPQQSMHGGALERNESIMSALTKTGVMQSPRFAELVAGMAPEDLKSLLSHKSFRMLDLPWNEIASTPKMQQQDEEDNTAVGLQTIAKKLIAMEQNNSVVESFDTNGDVDAEATVEKLKQQLEQNKKSMSALYKELDEERNASAVAVNEAMAMINRLQEEKAGIQMEALQYLRMMEEQAEYDQEAIQKLNDLLTDREKDLLDMEAELELYKRRYGEIIEEGASGTAAAGMSPAKAGTLLMARSLDRAKSDKMDMAMIPGQGKDYAVRDVLLGFEEEQTQIAECLRRLEEKVVNAENRVEQEGGDETYQVEASPENGSGTASYLQAEIFKLNERLCALDADREFLGHAINVLRYGSDGVLLVQEIASYLDELRRVPMAAGKVETQCASSQ